MCVRVINITTAFSIFLELFSMSNEYNERRQGLPEWKLFIMRVEYTAGVVVNQLEHRMHW